MKDALGMIDELVMEMNNFHFLQHTEAPSVVHPQTHSHVDESEIVGRKDEREQVVKILLDHSHNNNDNNSNVMVLPIVGMGGIGKTTLAQLVHNDQRVAHHFELVIWVCVSDKFVVEEIIRSIIQVATMKKSDVTEMEALRKELRGVLGKKRYLLVLDDVWNEDRQKWDDMRSLLCSHAVSGSAIIVTSRSDQVASIMGTLPPHQISLLDEDQSWELFHRNTFGRGVEKQEELISIAKSIVHKCKGSPLAIKTIAALLCSKHHSQWFSVLDSDVWKNDLLATKIAPALQLSYDHLSSEAKICFSLCAIFPKDSPLDKDMLIQLWMANDFIVSETRGQQIFDVLVWRCFLQDVEIDRELLSGSEDGFTHQPTTCKMHDLMHDLAESVSGNDCSILGGSSSHQEIHASSLQHEVRHLSLDYVSNNTTVGMKKILAPRARTILDRGESPWGTSKSLSMALSKFMSLRALKTISIETHMTKLKHLRYLDCSYSCISALPEATTMLYSLQTLKLIGCEYLKNLPEGIRYMSSLRHIFLDGCYSLKCMPQSIGQLNSLQTFTSYVIDSDDVGRGIDQLKDLNLGGALALTDLRKVHSAENAKQGNMSAKHNLKRLSLDWYRPRSEPGRDVGYEVDTSAEGILEALRPHKRLEGLCLSNYAGAKLSSWMHNSTLLEHLSDLCLSRCNNCKDLPPLWQLPSLVYLDLDSFDSLTSICAGNDDTDNMEFCISPPHSFPKLETMLLKKMPKLERWYQEVAGQVAVVSFPQLKRLEISDCPMLASMPKILPLLEHLWVQCSKSIPLYHPMNLSVQSNLECKGNILIRPTVGWQDVFLRFSNLGDSKLKLSLCGLTEDVEQLEEKLNIIPCRFIKKLTITNCDYIFSSEPSQIQQNIWNNFCFVAKLEISTNGIVQWPAVELRNLNHLRKLDLSHCSSLTGSLPSTISDDKNVLPPRLRALKISDCGNLVDVPKLPASLETLRISCCPKLVSVCGNVNAMTTSLDGMYGALKSLSIFNCPMLETVPEGLLQQLRVLERRCGITDCPKFCSTQL